MIVPVCDKEVTCRIYGDSDRIGELRRGCGATVTAYTICPVACDCRDDSRGRHHPDLVIACVRDEQITCRIYRKPARSSKPRKLCRPAVSAEPPASIAGDGGNDAVW